MLLLIFAIVLLGTTLTTYTQPTTIQVKESHGTTVTSQSITFSQAPTANDVLVCAAAHNAGSGATFAFPAGFTTLGSQQNVTTTLAGALAYRLVQAGDPSKYAVTTTASVGALSFGCSEIAYVNTTSPIMGSACFTAAAPTVTETTPQQTVTAPTTALSFFAAVGNVTDTSPVGATSNYDVNVNLGALQVHSQHSDLIANFQGGFQTSLTYSAAPTSALGCTVLLNPTITPFTVSAVNVVATPTPVPTATPTPAPTPTPGAIPKHVLTAIYLYGYAGVSTSVPVSFIAQWVDWGYTNSTYNATFKSAGVKTIDYTNHWRCYPTDNPLTCYTELKPGGTYAGAAALASDCTSLATDPKYGGGYQNDPRRTGSVNVAEDRLGSTAASFSAVFSDDTDSTGGLTGGLCNYSWSPWSSAVNSLHAAVAGAKGVSFFVNAINAWTIGATPAQIAASVTQPSAVLGAMAEGCFVDNPSGSFNGQYTGTKWLNDENAAIAVHNNGKIFWCYARGSGIDPTTPSGMALRLWQYASFLLTYDNPSESMMQSAMNSPTAMRVFPEFGIVPETPSMTSTTTVAPYLQSGGAYKRSYSACYNKGVLIGACAVLVNNTGSTVSVTNGSLLHSVVLHGGDVWAGGTVTFDGPACTTLAAYSACIQVP